MTTNGITLTDVGYVILFVKDVEKTAAFYRDVLGTPIKMASPEWTELDTKGTTLALHSCDEPAKERAGTPEVVFSVEDVRTAHAALRERDVAITDPKKVWEGGGVVGVSADFRDPEGNRLSIHGTVPAGEWTE